MRPSPGREKVPAERGDEGLALDIRTSSVAFGDTFSFKEKGACHLSPHSLLATRHSLLAYDAR